MSANFFQNRMMRVIFRSKQSFLVFFPPIRVHVWGGFGSQLFALALGFKLKATFKRRRIKFIFHSAGVTERFLELPESWLSGFTFTQERDFLANNTDLRERLSTSKSIQMKSLLISLLIKLGLLARLNTEEEFSRIKYWVISIRGHYSRLQLNRNHIEMISMWFNKGNKLGFEKKGATHFRMGDLLNLANKNYVSPYRVAEAWKLHYDSYQTIEIFSDSNSDVVQRILGPSVSSIFSNFISTSPIRTIESCCAAEAFVGTNSKLTIWIALLRTLNPNLRSVLPMELKVAIENVLLEQIEANQFIFY
jgi:hypothetical protein